MINDNKQAQRGSPLQGGPLLDPVQANPNQPYTPVPGAGQGTVYQPGRTILGKNYATPEDSPLTTLLSELPQTVTAVARTAQSFREYKKEKEVGFLTELENQYNRHMQTLLEEYPDGNIPQDRLREVQKQRIKDLDVTGGKITVPAVRNVYLNQLIKARVEFGNSLNEQENVALEVLRADATEYGQKASLGNPDAFSTFVAKSTAYENRLEKDRNELLQSGSNPERLREVNTRLSEARQQRIGIAVSFAKAELDKNNLEHPQNAEERTSKALDYLEGYGNTLQEAGYNEEEVDGIKGLLSNLYLNVASRHIEEQQQNLLDQINLQTQELNQPVNPEGDTPIRRIINDALTVYDLDVENALSIALDSTQFPELVESFTDLVLQAHFPQEAGLDLSPETFVAVGFSNAQARTRSNAIVGKIRESVSNELTKIWNQRQETEIFELEQRSNQQQLFLATVDYRDLQTAGVSGTRIFSILELQNDRLPISQRKTQAELVTAAEGIYKKSMLANPSVIQAITSGQLGAENFKEIFLDLWGIEESDDGSVEVVPLSVADAWLSALTMENTDSDVSSEDLFKRLIQAKLAQFTDDVFREVTTLSDESLGYAQMYAEDPQAFAKLPVDKAIEGLIQLHFAGKDSNWNTIPFFNLPSHLRDAKTAEEAIVMQRNWARENNVPIDFTDSQSMELINMMAGVKAAGIAQRTDAATAEQNVRNELNSFVPLPRLISLYKDYGLGDPGFLSPETLQNRLKDRLDSITRTEAERNPPTRTIVIGTEATFGFPPEVFSLITANYTQMLDEFVSSDNPEDSQTAFKGLAQIFRMVASSLGTANSATLARVVKAVEGATGANAYTRDLLDMAYPLITENSNILSAVLDDPRAFQTYLKTRKAGSGFLDSELNGYIQTGLHALVDRTRMSTRSAPVEGELYATLATKKEEGGLGVTNPNPLITAAAISFLVQSPFADKLNKENFTRSFITLYEMLDDRRINALDYAAEYSLGRMTPAGILAAIGEDFAFSFDIALHPDQGVIVVPATKVWQDGQLKRSVELRETPISRAQGEYGVIRRRQGLSGASTDYQVATNALWVSSIRDTDDPETTIRALHAWKDMWINDIMKGLSENSENAPLKEIRNLLAQHVDTVFSRDDFKNMTFAEITEDILKRW